MVIEEESWMLADLQEQRAALGAKRVEVILCHPPKLTPRDLPEVVRTKLVYRIWPKRGTRNCSTCRERSSGPPDMKR
jgi:hypothetical protein